MSSRDAPTRAIERSATTRPGASERRQAEHPLSTIGLGDHDRRTNRTPAEIAERLDRISSRCIFIDAPVSSSQMLAATASAEIGTDRHGSRRERPAIGMGDQPVPAGGSEDVEPLNYDQFQDIGVGGVFYWRGGSGHLPLSPVKHPLHRRAASKKCQAMLYISILERKVEAGTTRAGFVTAAFLPDLTGLASGPSAPTSAGGI